MECNPPFSVEISRGIPPHKGDLEDMGKVGAFLKRKNVLFSAKRYGIDAMGAMAQGLFASLLIGTIIKTLGQQLNVQFLVDAGNSPSRWQVRRWRCPSAQRSLPRNWCCTA